MLNFGDNVPPYCKDQYLKGIFSQHFTHTIMHDLIIIAIGYAFVKPAHRLIIIIGSLKHMQPQIHTHRFWYLGI